MRRPTFSRTVRIYPAAGAAALLLAGCETYAPLPLPEKPDLLDRLPVQGDQTLNMDQVATIAVINNPDLKSARFKAGVADAQAFQAGILPNPQLTAELIFPTNQEPKPASLGAGQERPGPGYSFGLAYDIQNLITQGAKAAAADAARDQAKLNILWQEWQTVSQARTLYVTGANAAEKRALYAEAEQRYSAQSERSSRAVQAGDVTFDAAATDLAALLDAQSQLRTTQRTETQNAFNIRALLGVSQNVDVTLRPLGIPDIPDRAAVEAALAKVAVLRPDLRALQAGYQSQEESLREAVLAQFPSLQIGLTRASDTVGDRSDVGNTVHTIGVGAQLNLPLFDRNQGNIAIQKATRGQLLAEYQARVDQTTSDAWRIWNEMQQLKAAIDETQTRLPELQTAAENAERAYMQGNLPALTAVTLENNVITRQAELSDLKQSLWSDSVALASVLGTQVEPVVEMKEVMP
jgi:cobalt-zinc-cadmium efflux system outer membrane protein